MLLEIKQNLRNAKVPTLKAVDIVEFIRSKTRPPAKVPNIPHTIVIPPNVMSAFFCGDNNCKSANMNLMLLRYLIGPQTKKIVSGWGMSNQAHFTCIQ